MDSIVLENGVINKYDDDGVRLRGCFYLIRSAVKVIRREKQVNNTGSDFIIYD